MPIDVFDIGAVVALAFAMFVLVRRIVRPRWLHVHVKRAGYDVPSTSWAHAAVDIAFAVFGYSMLYEATIDRARNELPIGFGVGFAAVPTALFILRMAFLKRARRTFE
jgi:hypothetical protein